jgi:hypothetical protein
MTLFKLRHFPKEIQLFLPDFDLGSYLGIAGTPPEKGLQCIQMCTQLLELSVKSLCLSPSILSFSGIYKVRKFY